MPEDLTPDGPWPLPTGRDELLQRVVTAGQHKLFLQRLLTAAAAVTLAGSLAAGAFLLRDTGSTDDATPAATVGTTVPSGDDTPTPETAEPATPPSPSSITPTTALPPSSSTSTTTTDDPIPSPTGPPAPSQPPDQPGPGPSALTVPPTPPPTTRPGPTTTSPPPVTVGPIGAEPEAIVELHATGTVTCPGATTSVISVTLGAATKATLTWKVGAVSGETLMAINAGTASAVLGPFDEGLVSPEASPSSITVTVTATGPGGQAHSTSTVTLIDCPRR